MPRVGYNSGANTWTECGLAQLISDLHVRFSEEEISVLREMGARQKAPASSVVRACVRHFILEWRKGNDVTIQLGAVVFGHTRNP